MEKVRFEMDEMTIEEVQRQYVTNRLVAVTGNGHLYALVPEDKVEEAEKERVRIDGLSI